jgi:hypothetical protein
MPTPPTIDEIHLAAHHYFSTIVIPERQLGELTMHPFMLRAEMAAAAATLTSLIWGQVIHDEEISYPEDWWEAVKQRWAPAWALRRWPVKMHTTTIKLSELYPEYRSPRLLGASVRVQVRTEDPGVYHADEGDR